MLANCRRSLPFTTILKSCMTRPPRSSLLAWTRILIFSMRRSTSMSEASYSLMPCFRRTWRAFSPRATCDRDRPSRSRRPLVKAPRRRFRFGTTWTHSPNRRRRTDLQLYTAEAIVTGGRDGHGRLSDGKLDLDVRPPVVMVGRVREPIQSSPSLWAAAPVFKAKWAWSGVDSRSTPARQH
jgi:hypothetical protein